MRSGMRLLMEKEIDNVQSKSFYNTYFSLNA